ncbi:MAG: hypothetical protein ACRC2R_27335 [Xenococcaceae cyanobacterium]
MRSSAVKAKIEFGTRSQVEAKRFVSNTIKRSQFKTFLTLTDRSLYIRDRKNYYITSAIAPGTNQTKS